MDIKSSGFSVHEEYDLLSSVHAGSIKESAFSDRHEYDLLDGIVPRLNAVTIISEEPSPIKEPGVHHERGKVFRESLHQSIVGRA